MNKNIKTNKKYSHITKIMLAVFTSQFFVLGGLGIFIESARAQDSIKLPDITAYSKLINIRSFLGKPVRVPIPSDNPDKVPGGDQDYVYVYPPQYFKNTKTGKMVSVPVKSIYFASGKKISTAKQKEVQDNLANEINYCFCNQEKVLTDLKNTLKTQSRMPKKPSYLNGIFSIFNIVHAEDTANTNTNLDITATTDPSTISDADIQTLLDSNDPQMKQMLMLLLLNLLLSQKMADASNVDKTTCLDGGGEWINNQCVTDQSQNQNNNSDKQTACEDSGGSWSSFSSSRSLCLSRCGKTDSKCQGSALADFEDAEGIIINSGDSGSVDGCKCPDGQCAGSDGTCVATQDQNTDDDNDGVPNGQDVCPGSGAGEGVNTNLGTATTGCSCSQLQLKGAYQQQASCPAPGCNGPNYTAYISQPGTCSNGVATSGQCVADNSGASNPNMAQQCNNNYQQQQADQQAQAQQGQQQLQDLLKQLMGGGQGQGGGKGGGQGGGKDQGGGGGGGCPPGGQPSGAPSPGGTDDKTKPEAAQAGETNPKVQEAMNAYYDAKDPRGADKDKIQAAVDEAMKQPNLSADDKANLQSVSEALKPYPSDQGSQQSDTTQTGDRSATDTGTGQQTTGSGQPDYNLGQKLEQNSQNWSTDTSKPDAQATDNSPTPTTQQQPTQQRDYPDLGGDQNTQDQLGREMFNNGTTVDQYNPPATDSRPSFGGDSTGGAYSAMGPFAGVGDAVGGTIQGVDNAILATGSAIGSAAGWAYDHTLGLLNPTVPPEPQAPALPSTSELNNQQQALTNTPIDPNLSPTQQAQELFNRSAAMQDIADKYQTAGGDPGANMTASQKAQELSTQLRNQGESIIKQNDTQAVNDAAAGKLEQQTATPPELQSTQNDIGGQLQDISNKADIINSDTNLSLSEKATKLQELSNEAANLGKIENSGSFDKSIEANNLAGKLEQQANIVSDQSVTNISSQPQVPSLLQSENPQVQAEPTLSAGQEDRVQIIGDNIAKDQSAIAGLTEKGTPDNKVINTSDGKMTFGEFKDRAAEYEAWGNQEMDNIEKGSTNPVDTKGRPIAPDSTNDLQNVTSNDQWDSPQGAPSTMTADAGGPSTFDQNNFFGSNPGTTSDVGPTGSALPANPMTQPGGMYNPYQPGSTGSGTPGEFNFNDIPGAGNIIGNEGDYQYNDSGGDNSGSGDGTSGTGDSGTYYDEQGTGQGTDTSGGN